MSHSESIKNIALALSKTQAELETALKKKDNPFFKSKYADLGAVWEACQVALAKNELAVAQFNAPEEGGIRLVTMLMHSSGEWIKGEMLWKSAKDGGDIQKQGSAITYMRRYGLAAMVGIVSDEDDDGEQASHIFKTARDRTRVFNACMEDINAAETIEQLEEYNRVNRLDMRKLYKSDDQIGQSLLDAIAAKRKELESLEQMKEQLSERE